MNKRAYQNDKTLFYKIIYLLHSSLLLLKYNFPLKSARTEEKIQNKKSDNALMVVVVVVNNKRIKISYHSFKIITNINSGMF